MKVVLLDTAKYAVCHNCDSVWKNDLFQCRNKCWIMKALDEVPNIYDDVAEEENEDTEVHS